LASPRAGLVDSDGCGIVGTALLTDGVGDGPVRDGGGATLAVGAGVGRIEVGVAAGVIDGSGDAISEGGELGVLVTSGAGIPGDGSGDEIVA
jgi:hypothetical protein